jgi:hypothetical protein
MKIYNSIVMFFNDKIIQGLILLCLSPLIVKIGLFPLEFKGPLFAGLMAVHIIMFSWFTAFICLKYCPLALKLQIFSFLSFSVIDLALDRFSNAYKISGSIYAATLIVLIIIFLYIAVCILWKRRWNTDIFYFILSALGTWSIPGIVLLMLTNPDIT